MDALTVEQIPTADLATFKGNPRRGDVKTIAASLRTNGQYRAIVVNRGTHTGRPMEVLAGNHTLMAARDLGWDTIAAHVIDVDEDRARRIVLADNRTAEIGSFDTDALTDLLQELGRYLCRLQWRLRRVHRQPAGRRGRPLRLRRGARSLGPALPGSRR